MKDYLNTQKKATIYSNILLAIFKDTEFWNSSGYPEMVTVKIKVNMCVCVYEYIPSVTWKYQYIKQISSFNAALLCKTKKKLLILYYNLKNIYQYFNS